MEPLSTRTHREREGRKCRCNPLPARGPWLVNYNCRHRAIKCCTTRCCRGGGTHHKLDAEVAAGHLEVGAVVLAEGEQGVARTHALLPVVLPLNRGLCIQPPPTRRGVLVSGSSKGRNKIYSPAASFGYFDWRGVGTRWYLVGVNNKVERAGGVDGLERAGRRGGKSGGGDGQQHEGQAHQCHQRNATHVVREYFFFAKRAPENGVRLLCSCEAGQEESPPK